MYYVNEHIVRYLLNEYKGSERKDTVLLDDGYKYMIKMPDPVREEDRKEYLSYINNAYSEYIGCHIASLMGFSVQETILGKYNTTNRDGKNVEKIVCLCRDVREKNENMRELDVISLSSEDNSDVITFKKEEMIFDHIEKRLCLSKKEVQEIKDFYYDLFIFDAFVGNTDRHNGNIAILLNTDGYFSRISPIYDCGSCLLPLSSDEELPSLPINSMALSINSVICDENGKRIRYGDFLINNNNPSIDKALKKEICKINIIEIYEMIDKSDYISDVRKSFYKQILQLRYEKILIPALEKRFSLVTGEISDQINLYQIYIDNIKQIRNMEEFTKNKIKNTDIEIMRINKKYALCMKDDKCIGLLPIRSNNDAVRNAVTYLKSIGIDITKDKLILEYNKENNSKQENLNNKQETEYEIDI